MTNCTPYDLPAGSGPLGWLLRSEVPPGALIQPEPIRVAHGFRADDGMFDYAADGPLWIVFEEPQDTVFWRPETGELARWTGRAFALGEDAIYNPATFSFDACLNVFESPLQWLLAGRDGCVIIDWDRTYDRLRHCPRVAVVESLLPKLKRHLQPPRLPELFVLRQREVAA